MLLYILTFLVILKESSFCVYVIVNETSKNCTHFNIGHFSVKLEDDDIINANYFYNRAKDHSLPFGTGYFCNSNGTSENDTYMCDDRKGFVFKDNQSCMCRESGQVDVNRSHILKGHYICNGIIPVLIPDTCEPGYHVLDGSHVCSEGLFCDFSLIFIEIIYIYLFIFIFL